MYKLPEKLALELKELIEQWEGLKHLAKTYPQISVSFDWGDLGFYSDQASGARAASDLAVRLTDTLDRLCQWSRDMRYWK